MIKLYLGNIGSGKTASAVRDMLHGNKNIPYYTNIEPKKKRLLPNVNVIKSSMIVKKELISISKNGKEVYKYSLNQDFWKDVKKPINVIIDEAHNLFNSRRAMSKVNIIMGEWIAMLRRILGQSDAGYGDLVMITQLWRRIDVIAREMCNHVKYHVCHYQKTCRKCGYNWREHSEMPEERQRCPKCNSWKVLKHSHQIEVYCFAGVKDFIIWEEVGRMTYYNRYMIKDIEKVFPLYDTFQWNDMISQLY